MDLKDEDLEPIRSQYSDLFDCTREMIKRWLRNSPHPNWKDLADALSSGLVKEANKATQLRLKYCKTSSARKEETQTTEDSVQAVWALSKFRFTPYELFVYNHCNLAIFGNVSTLLCSQLDDVVEY